MAAFAPYNFMNNAGQVAPPPPMRMRRHAFSLIELLVVVGIIGLLAAMLFPALRRAREAGKAALCTGNLHQLGLATQMYLDDYDRYFAYQQPVGADDMLWYFGLESPFAEGAPPGGRNLDPTRAVLYPYLKAVRRVEICPSYDYRSPKWRQKFNVVSTGYGLNQLITGVSLAAVANPSGIVVFGDSAQVNSIQAPASSTNPMLEEFYFLEYQNISASTTHFRHHQRAAVLFVDNHVSQLRMAPGTRDTRIPEANIGRLNATGDLALFQ